MQRFAKLLKELDEGAEAELKAAALELYFGQIDSADGTWAVYLLTGNRVPKVIKSTELLEIVGEASGFLPWLVEECHQRVGDLAETAALLLAGRDGESDLTLREIVEERILPLGEMSRRDRVARVVETWRELSGEERFVYNRLLTGGFRPRVQKVLVERALASLTGHNRALLAYRMSGPWDPIPGSYEKLMAPEAEDAGICDPYPFHLARCLRDEPESSLGSVGQWSIEWKWDGLRAQLIKRSGEVLLWTRGEEMLEDRFPEIGQSGARLPDGTVIDGEILAWKDNRPMPFGFLERRIAKRKPGGVIMKEIPVVFMAFDCLESAGMDLRQIGLDERREALHFLLEGGEIVPSLMVSPVIEVRSWSRLRELRAGSRGRGAEGLMIKRWKSPYGRGRVRKDWWTWQVAPYVFNAVLIYAESGRSGGIGPSTDLTFGVWRGGDLVPLAKVSSNLSDDEGRKIEQFVHENTLERFGPVRALKPDLVFEIAFDALWPSKRHKSGLNVRSPRILRWLRDKRPEDADTLERVEAPLRDFAWSSQ